MESSSRSNLVAIEYLGNTGQYAVKYSRYSFPSPLVEIKDAFTSAVQFVELG